ncbi:NPC intracellular cholesterol transporter 1 [Bulinus truncatus]|nr:NPC intracellular cholesterol transporter 1 [Bulinus truncatus]
MPDCAADCVWYGQCGHNTGIAMDKKINCKYSGPPKPFSTQLGVDKFKENCPNLYTGPNVTTCCSDGQILTLNDQVAFPRLALQRCPSCYHNFMSLWCYLTCGPKQAEFMSVNKTQPYVNPKNETVDAIVSVEYLVGVDSAYGMFNSCRNVQMPSSNEPAMSLLCGEDADTCTPQKWLDYMGTIQNGQAPFDIHFHISNKNMTFNGTVLKPLDMNPVSCNTAVDNTTRPCSCKDCSRNESISACQDILLNTCDDVFDPTKGSTAGSSFRLEEVIVSRPNNHTVVTYKNRNYTNIFDLTFLHEILDLQLSIANISAVSQNKTVGLQDFCLAPQSPNNTNCTVLSVLNYYQNSHEMLDKTVYDQFGWFLEANYLDHFEYCIDDPCSKSDATKLHTPCLGTFGGPVLPWAALSGYQNLTYNTATALVITFLVNDYKDSIRRQQVTAWEKNFLDFMNTYKSLHKDMDISYSSKPNPWTKSSGLTRPRLFKPKLTGKRSKTRATENFIILH